MKGHVDLLVGPATKVGNELTGISFFEKPDYSELFAKEKEILQNLKKIFLMVAGSAVQKFGAKLEEEQQLLLASSDILIEIYMAESSLLCIEKNAKRFDEELQKGLEDWM